MQNIKERLVVFANLYNNSLHGLKYAHYIS